MFLRRWKLVEAKKQKKNKIVIIALIMFTIYVIVSVILINNDVKKHDEDAALLQAQIDEQTILNAEVQRILDDGVDSDYIVKIAREKLGLVFPSERIYVDVSGK